MAKVKSDRDLALIQWGGQISAPITPKLPYKQFMIALTTLLIVIAIISRAILIRKRYR